MPTDGLDASGKPEPRCLELIRGLLGTGGIYCSGSLVDTLVPPRTRRWEYESEDTKPPSTMSKHKALL